MAYAVWRRMTRRRLKSDVVSCSTVMCSCEKGAQPGHAMGLLQSLPRLRVTPGRVHGEASAAATHAFFDRVLRLRRPFTVLWDPRGVRWPHLTPRHLRIIRAWVDANAEKWDTQVQAHALLLTNPIVRGVARLVIRLFAPPQPLRIVTSEEEALDFARTCCPRPKSWVKASYADRDERFKVFGSAWGLG